MNKIRTLLSRLTLFIVVFCFFSITNITNAADQDKNIKPKSEIFSFYFQDIDIRSLLQLIAKKSNLNFVISDGIKGNITLNLKNVTWQQALDIILKSRGLTSRHSGNVIYIGTIEEITTNETKKMQSDETISGLAPLTSRLVRLKYTNAADMATLLKGPQSSLLTQRGQVAVDSHTNSIIIRDTLSTLTDILPEIKKLDIPARQVLIEARLVNINVACERELGVRFGTSKTKYLSGTFQGANSLAQGTNPANVANAAGTIDPTRRLNFNNPARILTDGSNPGSIAIAIARIGSVLLDLELSALEGDENAQIIAKPRIVTANQQKAHIQQGVQIPYQEATSSGATSITFVNAVLSLEITPQITPDNKIILNIKATEDSQGTPVTTGSTGGFNTTQLPTINTQEVQSNVLLNNNETVVLGGIYQQTVDHLVDRVPFLSALPFVGDFFKHTHDENSKHELLIFVTPTIIKPHHNPSPQRLFKGEA